jgi:GNAT superfamily N-acetyltransferase
VSESQPLERMLDTMVAFFRAVGRASPGARVVEHEGVVATVVPATPERAVFNSVVYRDGPALIGALPDLAAAYARAGVHGWTVWVPEHDGEARAALAAAGHVLDAQPEAMALDLDSLVPAPSAPLVEVLTGPAAAIADVAALNDAAYGYPGSFARALVALENPAIHRYVALRDGRPLSCLLAVDHEGDCGIFCVATLAEARGQGLAAGLLTRALDDARGRGCRISTLQATRAGAPLYHRLGYRRVGTVEMWERRAR